MSFALTKLTEKHRPGCQYNIVTQDEAEAVRSETFVLLKHFFDWPGSAIRKFLRIPPVFVAYVPALCNVCHIDIMEHEGQCMDWTHNVVSTYCVIFSACRGTSKCTC